MKGIRIADGAAARVSMAAVLWWAAAGRGLAHNTGGRSGEVSGSQLEQLGLGHYAASPGADAGGQAPGSMLHELSTEWVTDPWIWMTLAVVAGLYVAGVARLWRATHAGRGISRADAAWYGAGWVMLVVALVSPLHPWGEVLFSAHMTQHEILMLICAPLLVMGRPLIAYLWALPLSWRRAIGRFSSTRAGSGLWRGITNPFVAWLVHGAALWMWHIPSWFEATLTSDFIHTLQHASFLGSALLFWWALMYGHRRVMGYGMAVVYLFTTAVHSGTLGALLVFTRTLWYPAYANSATAWGMSALEDQQLGGLIMWVPAGLVYIFAGLILFAAWLRESERKAVVHEAAWALPAVAATQNAPAGDAP